MIERLLSSALLWAQRHSAVVLIGSAVVAVGAVPLLLRLSFDSNVLNLLPQRGPAVASFQTYLRSFGSLDRLYIVFEAPPGQFVSSHSDLIEAYVNRLREAPEIKYVDAGLVEAGKDWTYVFDNELRLLGPRRVPEVLSRLTADAMAQALQRARETLMLPSADVKALVRQDPLGLLPLLRDRLGAEAAALKIDPTREGYVTPDGRSRLMIAEPVRPPYDTAFCRQLMRRLDSIEAEVRAAARDEASDDGSPVALTVERVGAYRAALETENMIRREGMNNAFESLASVLLLTYVVFRSFRILLCGAIPLLLAAVLTLVLNGVWYQLSTAASGSAAMLFGVGIDGVLLLYVRYLEERANGFGLEEATGRLPATVISMIMGFTTTAATYFGLMLIDFPSLEEVGRLIGMGILISGLLTILIVPALLPRTLSPRQARPLRADWLGRFVQRFRRPIIWTSVAVTAVLGIAAFNLRIVPTLQKLQPQTAATRAEREVFRRFSVPDEVVLVLATGPDLDRLLEVNAAVVAHLRERTPAVLITAPVSFIPPDVQQDEVGRLIRESRISAAEVSESFVRAAAQAGFRPDAFTPFLERLPRLLDPDRRLTYEGYGERGLGDLIGRYVASTSNDGYMTVAYAYPRTAEELRAVESALETSGQPVWITGVSLVNQELSRTFAPQFLKGGLVGTIAVAILIFMGFRGVRYTILSMLPTALGLWWSVGALALMNVELDLFSVFALLMCIGIGVDYSIHVLHRHAAEPSRSITEPLVRVAPAILLACATTLIGFGTLLTSSYGPLRTLGVVSTVTIAACLLTSLFLLPAVLLSWGHVES